MNLQKTEKKVSDGVEAFFKTEAPKIEKEDWNGFYGEEVIEGLSKIKHLLVNILYKNGDTIYVTPKPNLTEDQKLLIVVMGSYIHADEFWFTDHGDVRYWWD